MLEGALTFLVILTSLRIHLGKSIPRQLARCTAGPKKFLHTFPLNFFEPCQMPIIIESL